MRISTRLVGAVAVMTLISVIVVGSGSTASAISVPGCPTVRAPTLYHSNLVAGQGLGCGGHNTMMLKAQSPSGRIRLLKTCTRTLSGHRMWCPTGDRCRSWIRYQTWIVVYVQGRRWGMDSKWVKLC